MWLSLAAAAVLPALLAASAQGVAPQTDLKVYHLALTEFDAAAEVVRGLLSPEGRMVEDRTHHRLIVSDLPAVHERIREALRRVSVPLRNVRITVTSLALRGSSRESVGASAGVSKGGVAVRAGDDAPPSAAAVKAGAERSETAVTAVQELLVLSGARAAISVAEHTPHADWFWNWGGGRGLWSVQPGVSWSEVGASLVVQPTVIPDAMIRLRLTPRFSYFVDGSRTETEVTELATEVVLSDGAELDVGGMPVRDSEFYDRFLTGYDHRGETERLEIRVSARIQ
jgi:type II secretory pathway component GspD/PulD (secretin)